MMRSRSLRFWLVLFAISQTAVTFLASRISNPSDVLALQFTTSFEEFDQILAHWSDDDVHKYLSHFYLDFFHPFVFAALLFQLLKQVAGIRSRLNLALPSIAAAADIVENSYHIWIMRAREQLTIAQWSGACISSWLKWSAIFLSLFIILTAVARTQIRD